MLRNYFSKLNCGKFETPLKSKCYTLEFYSGQNQKKERKIIKKHVIIVKQIRSTHNQKINYIANISTKSGVLCIYAKPLFNNQMKQLNEYHA